MCKVSVIVPIYNVEKYIEKCVRSLFEQTFDDIEYIFVDDATPDNSIEILSELLSVYPNRAINCKIIHHKENKGLTGARNTGISVASGMYIIHFDGDDWAEKTMIEDMYSMAESQGADIVLCDFRMIYTDKIVNYYTVDWSNDKVSSLQNYICYPWNVIWNMLVKHDIYMQHKLKSLEANAAYCEDFNLAVKLLLHANKIIHLSKILYNYNRLNISSIMHNLNEKTMNDEQVMYLDVIDYFKKEGVYQYYKKQLCWRILKSKQEWVLSTSTYNKFLDLYPESHNYILSCPFLNIKLKIMMWCLVHHVGVISKFMLLLRYLKNRNL